MKDNIKQIAEKAGFMMWSDEPWKPDGAVVDWAATYDDELEKFAELLIRECAEFIRAKNFKLLEDDYPIGVSSEELLQHFELE
jgi:hypothetical protein